MVLDCASWLVPRRVDRSGASSAPQVWKGSPSDITEKCFKNDRMYLPYSCGAKCSCTAVRFKNLEFHVKFSLTYADVVSLKASRIPIRAGSPVAPKCQSKTRENTQIRAYVVTTSENVDVFAASEADHLHTLT